MIPSLLEITIVVLINVAAVALGFWVLGNNTREPLNRWFGVMAMSILCWVDFSYFGSHSHSTNVAIVLYRLNWAFVCIFLFSFYHFFVVDFLREKNIILRYGVYGLSVFFLLSSLFTNWVLESAQMQSWGVGITFGFLNDYFNLFSLFVASAIIYLGVTRYRKLDQKAKLQTQYFLFGIILYILFNVVFNIVSPIFLSTVQFQHYGDYSSIIFLGFTAYAMIKQKLFGAKVISAILFVVIIGGLLVLDIFVGGQDVSLRIFKGTLFLIFVVFGYFLIRSILREIKAREELAELSKALEKANSRLKKLDKTKSEFLSIASHQLRTPLSGIKGYLSMVLEGDFGQIEQKPKEILQTIYDNTERLNGLINDFLDVSRIERGKLVMERQPTDIPDMVQSIVNNFQPVADAKGLKLDYEPAKVEIPKVNVDANKLRQVIMNLVDNAIKYTHEGSVHVALVGTNDHFKVSVKDSGVGIDPDEAANLFKPFVRAEDASQSNATGSGLGLYVAKKIVQYHGGKVWAESEGKGKGSTFFMEVPYDQSKLPEPEPEPYLE